VPGQYLVVGLLELSPLLPYRSAHIVLFGDRYVLMLIARSEMRVLVAEKYKWLVVNYFWNDVIEVCFAL